MRQIAHVTRFFVTPLERCGERPRRRPCAVLGAQQQGVHALADAHGQNELPGIRALESRGQQQERKRRARVPAFGEHGFVALCRAHSGRLGDASGGAGRRRQGEVAHRAAVASRRRQQFANQLRHDLGERFVAYPALFEGVVEPAARHPIVIDEIAGNAARMDEGCERVLGGRPDEKRCRAIAMGELLDAARLRQPGVARDHERGLGRVPGRIEQPAGSRAQRGGDVQGLHVLGKIERGRNHQGIVAVRERRGGGAQAQRPRARCAAVVLIADTGAAGLHRHGDRILVPVGDGPEARGTAASGSLAP